MQTVYLPMTPQLNSRSMYSEEKDCTLEGGQGSCVCGVLCSCLGGMCWWFFVEVVWFGLSKKLFCWFHFVVGLILGFFNLMARYTNILHV